MRCPRVGVTYIYHNLEKRCSGGLRCPPLLRNRPNIKHRRRTVPPSSTTSLFSLFNEIVTAEGRPQRAAPTGFFSKPINPNASVSSNERKIGRKKRQIVTGRGVNLSPLL